MKPQENGTFTNIPVKRLLGLHPFQQVIFIWLCYHADIENKCFPSLALLLKETSIGRTSLIKHLKELEAKGLIIKKRENRHMSTCYEIPVVHKMNFENSSVVHEVNLSSSPNEPPVVHEVNPNYIHITKSKELDPITCRVEEVFNYWKEILEHPKSILDNKRKEIIKKALKSYSIDDLKLAIVGCSKTPHNMGINDRNEVYDGIHIIFRDAEHIERFINNSKREDLNNAIHKPKPQYQTAAQRATNVFMESCGGTLEKFKQQVRGKTS